MTEHQIWQEPGDLTTLCFADARGNDCRSLLAPGSKLIYSVMAESHHQAMTMYYQFMDWGTYTTDFGSDKEAYH